MFASVQVKRFRLVSNWTPEEPWAAASPSAGGAWGQPGEFQADSRLVSSLPSPVSWLQCRSPLALLTTAKMPVKNAAQWTGNLLFIGGPVSFHLASTSGEEQQRDIKVLSNLRIAVNGTGVSSLPGKGWLSLQEHSLRERLPICQVPCFLGKLSVFMEKVRRWAGIISVLVQLGWTIMTIVWWHCLVLVFSVFKQTKTYTQKKKKKQWLLLLLFQG